MEERLLDAPLLSDLVEHRGVDLLVDPRHRREVRRADLRQLVDDPFRIAAPEGERAAGLERRVLRHARERVRERQEQVDHHLSIA